MILRLNHYHRLAELVQFLSLSLLLLLSACVAPGEAPTPIRPGRIAFVSDRDGNQEIYVMQPDGSDQTRLTDNPADDYGPTWSPDGDRLVFFSKRETLKRQLYMMKSDGSATTRITQDDNDDSGPAWSPDGRQIALHKREPNFDVYLINLDGSGEINLTDNPAYADGAPNWSPDGTHLVFQSDRDGNLEIYVMKVDGSEQTRLTNNTAGNWQPAWSPDGQRIAFVSERDGNPEIYVMKVADALQGMDGSEQTRLTNNPAGETNPVWSPDSTQLAFVSDRDGNMEIYVMNIAEALQNLESYTPTRLTNNAASEGSPAWGP